MKKRPVILAVSLTLALATLLCYWPLTRHQFVSIDDHEYITDNAHVSHGLSWAGVLWAFKTGHASNWHPLTWISHMLDSQLYGLNPAGHHFTNLLFHLANTLLLFFFLRRTTGATWPSAFVAGLFAWHPLHVESVAWASERKDVLSTFFFLLALQSYAAYVRRVAAHKLERPGPDEPRPASCDNHRPTGCYLLTLLLFAFGLMSKPMVVTFPFVLLLVDIWPLRRLEFSRPAISSNSPSTGFPISGPSSTASLLSRFWKLVFEKLPFFALSLAASAVTYSVQQGAASSLDALPLYRRVSNAILVYGNYLGKILWPRDLSAIYPYPAHVSFLLVLAVLLFLVIVSLCFGLIAHRRPYLLVGWLWYLGTLVPTIGLVQVGSQSMADRYMYIPSIGLFILIVWASSDLFENLTAGRKILAGAGVAALAGCWVCTGFQLRYWQNSAALFRHALLVTKANYIAYDALGSALDEQGKHEEAVACYSEAVRLKPRYAEGQYDLGTALMRDGRADEAEVHLTAALADNPRFAAAHINLGKVLLAQGKLDDAASHLSRAAELAPDDPEALYNFGTVLLMQSKLDAAADCFSKALQLRPDYAEAHSNLGVVLMRMGRADEGAAQFKAALNNNPQNPEGRFNLGLALLEAKKPAEAVDQFSQALRLDPDSAKTHYHLALAFAQEGKTNQAATEAAQARGLALTAGQTQLVAKAETLLRNLPRPAPDHSPSGSEDSK